MTHFSVGGEIKQWHEARRELYRWQEDIETKRQSDALFCVMELAIDPSASKEVAMTSLDWCARSRQLTLLNAVLSAHFSNCAISDLERECSHVLRNAVTSGCKDTLVSLLRHVDDEFLQQRYDARGGDDVKRVQTRLEKLLGLAVEHGHRDVAEVLLSKGANPDSSYRNKPLLHLSLSLGHHCVASLLVEHGACVNMTDSRGETPLFAALSSDSNQTNSVIDDLISRGADVNHRSMTGRQPIHCAALTTNSSALTRLVKAGCDVNVKDGVMGDTPLHLACSRCCQEAVVTLIRQGAAFNIANDHGDTPLRKLLQHTTRGSKDFHHKTKIKLARLLVSLGFCLTPQTGEDKASTRKTKSEHSPHSRPENSSKTPEPSNRKTKSEHSLLCHPENSSETPEPSSQISKRHACTLPKGNTIAKDGQRHAVHQGSIRMAQSSWSSSCKRPRGRDKVAEVFQSLVSERRGVSALQHLCRLEVRKHLAGLRFQENVERLELSPQMRQYLMFLPRLIDDTVALCVV